MNDIRVLSHSELRFLSKFYRCAIGPNGFMARFTDTEGNRVAFHSMS